MGKSSTAYLRFPGFALLSLSWRLTRSLAPKGVMATRANVTRNEPANDQSIDWGRPRDVSGVSNILPSLVNPLYSAMSVSDSQRPCHPCAPVCNRAITVPVSGAHVTRLYSEADRHVGQRKLICRVVRLSSGKE